MNSTYPKIILCLLVCFSLTNISSLAQDIYPLVVHTQNRDGIAFNKEAITLVDQGVSFPYGLSTVNFDGSLLIAGEKILQIDSANQVSQTKISLDNPEQICLAWEKNLVLYKSQNREIAQIRVLDLNAAEEISKMIIKKDFEFDSLGYMSISKDALNIFFGYRFGSGSVKLEHASFDGNVFSSPEILDTKASIVFFISSDGTRIRYMANDDHLDTAMEIDRVDSKWTKPSYLDVGDDDFYRIVNLSGDGKSLLLKNEDFNLMLSYSENNQWSKPIDLGYQMSNLDHIFISEDGNTIAIAGARKPIPSFQSDALPVFDLYSLMKDANGKWVLTQLNDKESAVYRGQILLTPSGNKIFWVKQPVSELTGISQSGMY